MDLVTFTEEIFNGKLNFLCSESNYYVFEERECRQLMGTRHVLQGWYAGLFVWESNYQTRSI